MDGYKKDSKIKDKAREDGVTNMILYTPRKRKPTRTKKTWEEGREDRSVNAIQTTKKERRTKKTENGQRT